MFRRTLVVFGNTKRFWRVYRGIIAVILLLVDIKYKQKQIFLFDLRQTVTSITLQAELY